MPGRRVNDHSGRLVDEDDVRVFVNDVQWNGIRENLVDLRRGYFDAYDLARRHAKLGLPLEPIHEDMARFDQALYHPSAQIRKIVGDVSIEPGSKV
jgi:hypothetical protein